MGRGFKRIEIPDEIVQTLVKHGKLFLIGKWPAYTLDVHGVKGLPLHAGSPQGVLAWFPANERWAIGEWPVIPEHHPELTPELREENTWKLGSVEDDK